MNDYDSIPLFENAYISVFHRLMDNGYPYTVVKTRTGKGATVIPMISSTETEPAQYLVISQPRPPIGGISWEFPSGGVDFGEEVKVAAMRELEEETDIHTTDEQVHFLGNYHSNPAALLDEVSLFIAVLPHTFNKNSVKVPEDEILDYKWLTLQELKYKALTDQTYGLAILGKLAKAKYEGYIIEPLTF